MWETGAVFAKNLLKGSIDIKKRSSGANISAETIFQLSNRFGL